MKSEGELLYREEVYAIVGAAIEVHRELGPGFLEAVYHEAMEIVLTAHNIPFKSNEKLRIRFKEILLRKEYEADFICYDKIIVEIKALDVVAGKEEAQLLHYLKTTGFRIGLLINFGSVGTLKWKRYIR
ncbi:MAG: GxxExxY protein [Ignavibacteriales bacterium]|nr:GxxExxY protein [Ignavibacteriales bacterium]